MKKSLKKKPNRALHTIKFAERRLRPKKLNKGNFPQGDLDRTPCGSDQLHAEMEGCQGTSVRSPLIKKGTIILPRLPHHKFKRHQYVADAQSHYPQRPDHRCQKASCSALQAGLIKLEELAIPSTSCTDIEIQEPQFVRN